MSLQCYSRGRESESALLASLASLLGVLPPALAASACPAETLDTRIDRRRRQDRSIYVADAPFACTVLPIRALPGLTLEAVTARVVRTEQRALVFGEERLTPTATGWDLHLPEMGPGDVADVRVEWARTAEPTVWQPPSGADTTLTVRGRASLWLAAASAESWWTDRAPSPEAAAPQRLPDHRVLVVGRPGIEAAVTGPARPRVDEAPPVHHSVSLVPASGTWLPHEPPPGVTVRATWWSTESVPAWAPPPQAAAHGCAAGSDALAQLSAAVGHPLPAAGPQARSGCAWVEPRLQVAGEIALDQASLVVSGLPAADGFATEGLVVEAEGDRLRIAPGTGAFSWALSALAGRPVLPDRQAALSLVAYASLRASLPEPGLPLAYKNRREDPELAADVLALVRARARTDSLPTRGPLHPRRLVEIKRAAWATPWEQALLLSRLLRQAKLAATPVPVRPAAAGALPDRIPVGYTDAVVFLAQDHAPAQGGGWGSGRFLAPTCPVCAVGELPPALWGGQVLTEGQSQLPVPRAVAITASARGERLVLELDPPAALALRLALLAYPADERGRALPGLVGAPERSLVEQTGLETHGAPATLVLSGAADTRPAWSSGRPLGWAGAMGVAAPVTVEARRPAPARAAVGTLVEQEGPLRWQGSVHAGDGGAELAESLTVSPGAISPAAAARFDASVRAATRRLLTPVETVDDSTDGADAATMPAEVP